MKKKTKEIIEEEKLIKQIEFKYSKRLDNLKLKFDKDYEHQKEKLEKKKKAEINRRVKKLHQKYLNQERKKNGKPVKIYKTKPKTRQDLFKFGYRLVCETAKLRDTDENGNGTCISCGVLYHWEELVGGHRFTVKSDNIALDLHNVNAQCNSCNWVVSPSGPGRDSKAYKIRKMLYNTNLVIKYGPSELERLHKAYHDFKTNPKLAPGVPELKEQIEGLIDLNEELRKTKKFYKPALKRREYYKKLISEML